MPYTRPQLWLLLLLAGIFLAGLAVREWRAGFPELAERIERFDREEPPEPLAAVPLREPRPPARESRPPRPPHAPAHEPAAVRGARGADGAPGEPGRAADPRPLDLNAASLDEIARLPGIGPGLARRIVEERERRGRFDSPEGLRGVLGLGPKKLAAVRDLVIVGGALTE